MNKLFSPITVLEDCTRQTGDNEVPNPRFTNSLMHQSVTSLTEIQSLHNE